MKLSSQPPPQGPQVQVMQRSATTTAADTRLIVKRHLSFYHVYSFQGADVMKVRQAAKQFNLLRCWPCSFALITSSC